MGTKLDLREDPKMQKQYIESNILPITSAQGLELSEEIGAYRYHEASAKTQQGLKEVFNSAIEGT